MDVYGPLFERLRQGVCQSAMVGFNDYFITVQVCVLVPSQVATQAGLETGKVGCKEG